MEASQRQCHGVPDEVALSMRLEVRQLYKVDMSYGDEGPVRVQDSRLLLLFAFFLSFFLFPSFISLRLPMFLSPSQEVPKQFPFLKK